MEIKLLGFVKYMSDHNKMLRVFDAIASLAPFGKEQADLCPQK